MNTLKDTLMNIKLKPDTKVDGIYTPSLIAIYNKTLLNRMSERDVKMSHIIESLDTLSNVVSGTITISLGRPIGFSNIAKYDISKGLHVAIRKHTGEFSIVSNTPPTMTDKITLDLEVIDKYMISINNVYYGEPVPLEIYDSKLSLKDFCKSYEFWNEHGFSYSSELFKETIVKIGYKSEDIFRILYHNRCCRGIKPKLDNKIIEMMGSREVIDLTKHNDIRTALETIRIKGK
jgi:hypothetical protein